MATIYTHIDDNKRDSTLLIAIFISFIALIGWFLGEYFADGSGLAFLGFALIFSGISTYISYYNSDKIILAVSKAHPVTREENPYLYNIIENLSIGSGLPMPKVYMIEDSAMNAFATGRDPEHSIICFTRGIVDRLDKLELEGVAAHELSHIGNYDIRLLSLVSVLVGSITLVSDFFLRGYFRGRRRRDSSSGIIFVVGIIFIILSPIIAALIKLALSRHREYLADSTAALLTRYPDGLANALRKLAADKEVLEAANGATAHLYIVNPFKGGFKNLFETHPPIEERIKRLVEM